MLKFHSVKTFRDFFWIECFHIYFYLNVIKDYIKRYKISLPFTLSQQNDKNTHEINGIGRV